MEIKQIIEKDFAIIKESEPIELALEKMNRMKINGMPVINEDQKLVGIIVKADIYRFLTQRGHFDTCPVDWVMSKGVITADSNEDIISVAQKLRKNDIIAMPVLEDEKIIGIVSIEDILDYFIENN